MLLPYQMSIYVMSKRHLFTVNQPSVITATATLTSNYYGSQISCNGVLDGRITVTASGGTGVLSYALVEIPGNTSGAITGVFTGLPAGTYTFTVTDKNGRQHDLKNGQAA